MHILGTKPLQADFWNWVLKKNFIFYLLVLQMVLQVSDTFPGFGGDLGSKNVFTVKSRD